MTFGVVGQVQVTGLTAAEDQDLQRTVPGGLEVRRVGDDLGRRRRARTASARSTSGGISTATAPSRDSAAMATSALGRVSISTPT